MFAKFGKLLGSLAGKLALIQTSFLIVALTSIAFTIWVSWQLEGGAGAINEAGRMRMMTYKLALAHRNDQDDQVADGVRRFDAMLINLRDGDPSRPLFIPDNKVCLERFAEVERAWIPLRTLLLQPENSSALLQHAEQFVGTVDQFVSAIEHAIATRTAVLEAVCFGLVILVIAVSVMFVSGTFVWIIQPLQRLRDGLLNMADRDFSVRVDEGNSVEEFTSLAQGFNQMADALEQSYKGLEDKVAEKTSDLARQNERLAALYDVALMAVEGSDSMESLSQTFAVKIARIANADASAVRMITEDNERLLLLGHSRLPRSMSEAERCIQMRECACGEHLHTVPGARVIPIRALNRNALKHCEVAGYQSLVVVPMRTQHRTIGEVSLFFYGERQVPDNERQLLDALVGHFAAQLDNIRLAARDREMAVSEERNMMAQELHDSIAQTLAFMKIQVQLLRGAIDKQRPQDVNRSLDEIDAGVRESYADVRELLLHFRTRPGHEDIEHALRSTLSKFELQSGLSAQLTISGHGVPLPPDQQIQVLHVMQEALSNVRKHAGAKRVELRVQQEPYWHFEVRDDGQGFDSVHHHVDETHVGLRIMRERAARIGATLDVQSRPGGGTQISLSLPLAHIEDAADSLEESTS